MSEPPNPLSEVGVVAIGRNESARLRACLASLPRDVAAAVYVDSGSTDDSFAIARSAGVAVVALPPDAPQPPSAARARNAGLARLLELAPRVCLVQFVDGDCELDPDWLPAAVEAIHHDPALGAVWGLRREAHPDASVYNRICDLEWRIPGVGATPYFGGDALLRVEAFRAAGGYDPDVIASEDQELSIRLRKLGWHIARLDRAMTVHDARMTRFGQWWRRGVRRGAGYVETWTRHRRRADTAAIARIVLWAVVIPVAALACAPLTRAGSLLILLLYPIRIIRIAASHDGPHRTLWGVHCVAAVFPYAWGLLRQGVRRSLGAHPRIIEYHPPPPT